MTRIHYGGDLKIGHSITGQIEFRKLNGPVIECQIKGTDLSNSEPVFECFRAVRTKQRPKHLTGNQMAKYHSNNGLVIKCPIRMVRSFEFQTSFQLV